jgi:hypothetical protein
MTNLDHLIKLADELPRTFDVGKGKIPKRFLPYIEFTVEMAKVLQEAREELKELKKLQDMYEERGRKPNPSHIQISDG